MKILDLDQVRINCLTKRMSFRRGGYIILVHEGRREGGAKKHLAGGGRNLRYASDYTMKFKLQKALIYDEENYRIHNV